jgi:hypothetical protein
MFIDHKKRGYTLVELLMYTALLGLVMSFIAIIFRHMLWRDRLEKHLDDHLRLKTAFDMSCEALRNSVEVIRPKSGELTSKIIVLKNDGTYQKIGMYSVGDTSAFISRTANTLAELDADTDYETGANIFSKYVKKFYAARPFYNHILVKAVSANNSVITSLTLDSVKIPADLLFHKDYYREYRNEFTSGSYIVNISEKLNSNYTRNKQALNSALINPATVNKFMAAFDAGSASSNPIKSKSSLKQLIGDDGATDIGRLIFYTAYLIDKASNEISLANAKRIIKAADKDITETPEDIFGADIISDYRLCAQKISFNARGGLKLKPDYKTMLYELKRVCDYNKNSLLTQMGIASPYTGNITDERGNVISVINLHYGKTVPFSINDLNLFSEIEGSPDFNSPDTVFSSIYQIIDSKIPYISAGATFAQNLDAFMYASKNIKKVIVYSNKIDIFDHKIKFGHKVIFNGREYDLAFFIRQAAEMALTKLPDTSKIIPIPISVK